ncbi:MAG: FtsX-like permease family protein [Promethearchaeota archaeon]
MSFFKIAAKNLTKVKSRTILTVLAIALGTALLAGITILNDSYLESYVNGVSEQLGYTDLGYKRHINVSDGYFYIDDFLDDTNLEKIDGYLDHTGRIVDQLICTDFEEITDDVAYETTFFGIDVENDVGYGYAEFLEWTKDVEKELDGDPEIIEDVLALNEKYVVITTWIKEVYNFELGEEIMVPLATDPLTDYDNSSTWERYTVAAVINDYAEGRDINFDYSKNKTSSIYHSRAMYFDISEVRKMENLTTDKINLLYVHVELDKIQQVYDDIKKNLPNEYYGYNIKSGELEKVYDNVRSMQLILIIFTLISFIIAIMLTLNTLMMSVNEQKYEVGVLRAQGIYKKEIFKMFFYEALLLALIGSICGILLGLVLSPMLKQIFFNTMMAESTFDLVLSIKLTSLLLVFGITFFISLLIGILPALIATRIEIIEAIRNIKTGKKGKKIRKVIFPIFGLILTGIGYYILLKSNRRIEMTLIGIIPFILGLIIISTVLIPLLSKAFSYLFAFFLGAYRKITNENLKRDPKQTKITFIMFGLAIGFLVMISNVLYSVEIVQKKAIPRYLRADIIIYSEGSTFGMDDLLIEDEDIIDGSVESAALLSSLRVKVDDYGTFYSDKNDEPRVNFYIIEGEKFEEANNEIEMADSDGLSNEEIFQKLDNQINSTIVCQQLLDKDHLDKEIGDLIEVDLGGFKFKLEIIGIADFVSGFSETWEEPSDIKPAEKNGKYCLWVSWNSIIPLIDDYFDWLPQLDILVKGDNHDADFWDFPPFNGTSFRHQFKQFTNDKGYKGMKIAERVWDQNASTAIADSGYDLSYLMSHPNSYKDVHIAFLNTSLEGTTEFYKKKDNSYETISDALIDGKDYCVITKDIYDDLGLDINDKITVWHKNGTGPSDYTQKNLTIAGIIKIDETIEAVNFHSQNPYVSGNYDVAEDDSTAIIVNINTTSAFTSKRLYQEFFNSSKIFEFWIKFNTTEDYFDYHLKIVNELEEFFGPDFVFADMRWIYTQEFSYAPTWMIQVSDEDKQEKTLEQIKEFLLLNKMPVISWITADELQEQYSDQINFQKAFFNIVLSFALIIAVLGIMINMLISISNRKREIGMMRAIGTYKRDMIKMILGETLILVLSGFIIGAIMGTFAAKQLLLGLPLDAVFDLRLYIDYISILILFGIVLIISIVAAALPCYKVLKLDVIEAIRAI